jgi:hypothetical protein
MNSTFEGNTQKGTDVWLTPPHILEAIGHIDLDPCASDPRPWPVADRHYTKADNGLLLPWEGFVFCNPPYGKGLGDWLQKCHEHGNAIALVFARTDTQAYHQWVFAKAHAIFFIAGRLSFYTQEGTKAGTAGSPSMLIAYGANTAQYRLQVAASKLNGSLITLRYQ